MSDQRPYQESHSSAAVPGLTRFVGFAQKSRCLAPSSAGARQPVLIELRASLEFILLPKSLRNRLAHLMQPVPCKRHINMAAFMPNQKQSDVHVVVEIEGPPFREP